MKNFTISLAILFISFNTLTAQELSKAEKKALLTEIKAMKKSPEKLLKIKQTQEFNENLVDEQSDIISGLKNEVQVTEKKLTATQEILAATEIQLGEMIKTQKNLNSSGTSTAPMNHTGKKYRVQIGLYKNLDFSYLLKDPKYLVHEYIDGTHRYSIGNFNSEEEADLFKVEMRKLGVKGAFVSTYTDGLRTDNLAPTQSFPTPVPQQSTAPIEITTAPKNTGFNVKPAASSTNIESNPNRAINGTVISSTPVKVVPNQAVPEQKDFQFQEESTKTSGIKINVGK